MNENFKYIASAVIALLLILLKLSVLSPAIFCILIVVLMLVSLVSEALPPEISLSISLGVLLSGSYILGDKSFLTPQEAFGGFSNEAVITIAALFIVASAVRSAGIFNVLAMITLGNGKKSK